MSIFRAGDGDGQFVRGHEPGEATFDRDAARRFPGPQPERARPQRQPQADGPRDVTHLAGWVAAQPEGNRNAGLFRAACRAVEAGDSTALDAMARAAAAAGLTEQEITGRSALPSVARSGALSPMSERRAEMTTPADRNHDLPAPRRWNLLRAPRRIPTERPSGLRRLLCHRPGRQERDLLAARDAATGQEREAAFRDHASYLANVWMPAHPRRAVIESRLQERGDRRPLSRPDADREAGQ